MSFGAGWSEASTALTRSLTGMEEMKSSAAISVRLPSESSYTTDAILPSFWRISTTLASVMTFTPAASQLDSTVSHSWPGPSFGYQNSSMREVSTSELSRFFGRSFWKAFFSTPMMLRPLTRCAPQSAEISDG